jgi:hypothetical protein
MTQPQSQAQLQPQQQLPQEQAQVAQAAGFPGGITTGTPRATDPVASPTGQSMAITDPSGRGSTAGLNQGVAQPGPGQDPNRQTPGSY